MQKIIVSVLAAAILLSTVSCGLRPASETVATLAPETTPRPPETVTTEPPVTTTAPQTTVTTEPVTTEIEINLPQTEPEELLPPNEEELSELMSLLAAPPEEDAFVAFYYEDMATGYRYCYNETEVVYGASLKKLAVAVGLLLLYEEGEIDLDGEYVLTGEEDPTGTGIIKNEPVGTVYTYPELIYLLVRESDNIALRVLDGRYGREAHYDFLRSIGADSMFGNWGWDICAADGAKVLRAAWEYVSGDNTYSELLEEAMLKCAHSVMICPGVWGKPVARKYGWDVDAYHDMGIIYDEHPYMLVFLSDMDAGTAEINEYIHSLVRLADSIHVKMYAK